MELLLSLRNKFSKLLNLTHKDKIKIVLYSLFFNMFLIFFKIFGYKNTRYLTDKIINTEDNKNNINKNFINCESTILAYASSNSLINSTCLEKSIFIYLILGMHGIKTELKFGVNNSYKDFKAHAWVEYHGMKINDPPETVKNIFPFKTL